MDSILVNLKHYLNNSIGTTIRLTRPKSKRKRLDLKITDFDEESGRISIFFVGGSSVGLPLYLGMFDRVIKRLSSENGFVPVGARLTPPYMPGSLEEAIWEGKSSPYKAAPHVCDILVAAGLVEYGVAENPETGRRVQGARLIRKSFE